MRKLGNVRENELTLKLGVPNAAKKDEPYQTNASFDACQSLGFLQGKIREMHERIQLHWKTHKEHRQRNSDPPKRALVHNIPRKRRRLQGDRQAGPSGPRILRVHQRSNPNGPFLHMSLREKVILRETVEDEG